VDKPVLENYGDIITKTQTLLYMSLIAVTKKELN